MKIPLLELQEAIYNKLNINPDLQELVTGIYTHLPQNSKFPYIHLGKQVLKSNSSNTTQGYEIISNVGVYHRERSNKYLFVIADIIKQLVVTVTDLKNFNVIDINFLSCVVDQASDGLTSFAIIQFKSIIQAKS